MPKKKKIQTSFSDQTNGKKQLDNLELVESILHEESLVELLGTSPKESTDNKDV